MYSFISVIDIVAESITQLHRVFISHEKLLFEDKLFENDDNEYFKQIRACFGAYPVNLNPNNSNKQRYFASWPFNCFSTEKTDLDVRLYSNKLDEEDLTLSLKADELISFLKERYYYLDVIIEEINRQFLDYKKDQSKKPITANGSPLEVFHKLAKESAVRLGNDYYHEIINDLIIIFRTTLGDEYKVEEAEFKKSLLPLIEEIKTNLQMVDIKDLDHYSLVPIKSTLNSKLSYELPKFYS